MTNEEAMIAYLKWAKDAHPGAYELGLARMRQAQQMGLSGLGEGETQGFFSSLWGGVTGAVGSAFDYVKTAVNDVTKQAAGAIGQTARQKVDAEAARAVAKLNEKLAKEKKPPVLSTTGAGLVNQTKIGSVSFNTPLMVGSLTLLLAAILMKNAKRKK